MSRLTSNVPKRTMRDNGVVGIGNSPWPSLAFVGARLEFERVFSLVGVIAPSRLWLSRRG